MANRRSTRWYRSGRVLVVFVVFKPAAFRASRAVVLRRSGRCDAFVEARTGRSKGLAALEGGIAGSVPDRKGGYHAASLVFLWVFPTPRGGYYDAKSFAFLWVFPTPRGGYYAAKSLAFLWVFPTPGGGYYAAKSLAFLWVFPTPRGGYYAAKSLAFLWVFPTPGGGYYTAKSLAFLWVFPTPRGGYYAAKFLAFLWVFPTPRGGYYAAKGVLVSVSCWDLMPPPLDDDSRETGSVDVSRVPLQRPCGSGSLLEQEKKLA
jgi:hypothetical protein